MLAPGGDQRRRERLAPPGARVKRGYHRDTRPMLHPGRRGPAEDAGASQSVLRVVTERTQVTPRQNNHPGHTRITSTGFRRARSPYARGPRPGHPSTPGRPCLGTPADSAAHRERRAGGPLEHGPAVGRPAGGRLAGAGRAAGVVQPPPGHAAGQPGRDRVPDRGAGARGRARRGPVRLDAVPGRLSAADHAGVLVHQQPRRRLPRGTGGQRGDQRRRAAARLPGLPQARAGPPGRLRRGRRGGPGARRVLLQPVRDDRRSLPGDHAGLAAGHAQLADRLLGAGRSPPRPVPRCWPRSRT